MLKTIRAKPQSVEEVIVRYPRLTAHLIAESLGYFTPRSAANAILRHIQGHSFYCEWYVHCAQSYDEQKVIEVGRNAIRYSFQRRRFHTGYMASYAQAKLIVDHVKNGGRDPIGASWF